ncbi:MAG: DNA mismatch repair protein MutS [Roseiarcus sp.]|uniref:MutS-related protein n=1 Tax=Roseiarcus sp. TaxID=1969460 RepID=UPI003C4A9C84
MTFQSILFKSAEDRPPDGALAQPVFFVDLNLDQIVATITAGKAEYNLAPFFHWPLRDVDAIHYRHEVMRDLEDIALFGNMKTFAAALRSMRETLKQLEKRHYRHEKEALFLDAVDAYCGAISSLTSCLGLANLHSRGLMSFRRYITDYAASDRFTSLLSQTRKLKADISSVKYTLQIRGGSITVRKYDSEINYTDDVEETFLRFKQGAVKDYRLTFKDYPQMNHVEAAVMDRVARLYAEIFANVTLFCENNSTYLDATIDRFDREVQFYVAYLDYLAPFRRTGLSFCYPDLSSESKEIYTYDAFDLALASVLKAKSTAIVCNDFYLKDNERIFIVSGPNNGGKTTFARMFGQLHYLASLGCLIPARSARLFLFDQILTHFEREEDISNLRGKLQDDLVRIHEILSQATSESIIVMNEIFSSGTLKDAIFLGTKVIERIIEIDALCVCVTFIDELTLLSDRIVSAVSTIVPERPAVRTYKIVRKPADGLAYAMSIAEKYGLTRRQILERIKS